MTKRPRTPAQLANDERLRQKSKPETTVLPSQSQYDDSDIAELKKQIEELKAMNFNQPQYNNRGSLIGTFEKFSVKPESYPDPRERLSKEQRLQQFAFPLNWELKWEVTSTPPYETIDGRRVTEPVFTVELIHIHRDEDGNPTNKRLKMKRLLMHEDPQAAIMIARENGITVDESNESHFLDEMRYLRIRDWLLDAFYPPKASETAKRKEEVIGGRLVEVYTVNSEGSSEIPFDQMKKAQI